MSKSSPHIDPAGANKSSFDASSGSPFKAVNSEISERVERLFDIVPEIGTRWRWYDIPYRFFSWWLRSWRFRLVPYAVRRLLIRGMNFFMAFNQHERNKAEALDDPERNLNIPDKFRLRQGGIWAVELFLPSQYKSLERAMLRNGWDSVSFRSFDESNAKKIKRARGGGGFSWTRIGAVVRPNTNFMIPDAKREVLSDEFEYIDLTAFQLGTSITAVVAYFRLSESGESSLDRVLRKAHEPTLTLRWFHPPKLADRHFAAIEATQRERMRIHDLARAWLSQRCPGFFASRSNRHPILDLNLFDGFDPVAEDDRVDMREPLRALGMGMWGFYKYISPQMKGTVLVPTDRMGGPHEPLQNCWSIAGDYKRAVDENGRPGYGSEPYAPGTLGHMFDNAAGSFVLHLAVIAYISEQRAIYSASRDLACARHRHFTARKARKLSTELLESGLDLSAVARDFRHLWRQRSHRRVDVQAFISGMRGKDMETFDFIESLGVQHEKEFKRLLEEDETYRTVLSTAASLGASADATRTGRLALVVATGSMIVATMTLLVTQPGNASLWSEIVKWLGLG